MENMNEADLWPYAGTGRTLSERKAQYEPDHPITMPDARDTELSESADKYVADAELRAAVNVALILGQPLLITGEPGTGKTQLAWSIAYELELPYGKVKDATAKDSRTDQAKRNRPLVFHTKTTSTARDLFYHYDALQHFQDVQLRRQKEVKEYITFEALGTAILLSDSPRKSREYLPEELHFEKSVRSVVLIDEIDKAPRDLPNDILNEIDEMEFEVKQLDAGFKASKDMRPIIILTSNSEKNLPDAFLRRCVFHHISFPEELTSLKKIVDQRLKARYLTEQMRINAIEHFQRIRALKASLQKAPATAELLTWLRVLEDWQLDVSLKENQQAIIESYAALAKNADDRVTIIKELWSQSPPSSED